MNDFLKENLLKNFQISLNYFQLYAGSNHFDQKKKKWSL